MIALVESLPTVPDRSRRRIHMDSTSEAERLARLKGWDVR